MKKWQDKFARPSWFQITLAIALISISALLAAPAPRPERAIVAPTLTETFPTISPGDLATEQSDEGARQFSQSFEQSSQPEQPSLADRVDTVDVIATFLHFLGISLLTGCSLDAADSASPFGSINNVDVVATQRFYLGITGTGRAGQAVPSCANVYGDVAPSVAPNPTAVTVSLPIDSFDTAISTVIIKPVLSTSINAGQNFIGFQGDFTFDSAVVSFASSPVLADGLTGGGWSVSGNVINTGPGTIKTLRFSAYANNIFAPLSGSGTLFQLRMLRVSSTTGQTSPMVWEASPNNFIFIDTGLATFAPTQDNGLITITGPTLTPTPTAAPTPSPTPTASPTAPPTATPTATPTPIGATPTPTPQPLPDRVDTVDVIATQWHFLGISFLPGCSLDAADCASPFGSINTVDAIAIQRFYLGLTGTGIVGQAVPSCANVYGDVALSTVPYPTAVTVSLPNDSFDTAINTVIIEPVLSTSINAGQNFIGFQGDFTFDSAVISFASPPVLSAGLTGSGWTVSGNVINTGPGTIKTLRFSAFANDDLTPLSGSGTLFQLRMLRVSGTTGQTSPMVWELSPNNFIFIDAGLTTFAPTQDNGLITITGPTLTPTPTAAPTPSPTSTPSPTAPPTATPTATPTPIGATPTPTPQPLPNRVDTVDVIATQWHFLGTSFLTGCSLDAADCASPFGSINSVDIVATQRFYLGLTGTGIVGQAVPSCGNVYGDVALSTVPYPTAVTVSLPIDTFDAAINTVVIEAVQSTNINAGQNIIGFQGDFTFDSSIIDFASSPVQAAGLTSSGWTVSGNVINTGPGTMKTLRVSAFVSDGLTGLSGSGTLFQLRMLRVGSTTGQTTSLAWESSPNNFIFIDTGLITFAPTQPNGRITITTTAPQTEVGVSGGNLVITGSTLDDQLTISCIGGNVRIEDPNNTLNAGIGAQQIDGNTIEVPLASITGYIEVNTLGGNDTLTLDLSVCDFIPATGLTFNGGDQTGPPGDSLTITTPTLGTVTYNYSTNSASDGAISLTEGDVDYTGLEPIINSGTAADIIFNLPAGPNAVTLGDDGSAGNGMSRLSGVTFETTDFANPTGAVTINRGSPADTLTVNLLPDFNRSLIVGSVASPFSTTIFSGDLAIVINGVTAGSQYTQFKVAGAVDLVGVNLILSGSYVLTGGESFTIIENDGVDAITGVFSGLPEGAVIANLLGSGFSATISYLGGTGNDTVITASTTPTLGAISGATKRCTGVTTSSLVGATMTLTGSFGGSTTTDGSGNYSFLSLASNGSYTVTPTKPALLPASAGITTTDVLATQRHFLGVSLLSGCALLAGDCAGSTGVTTQDVLAIQRFFLGFGTGIGNVGAYSFTPVNRTYAPLSITQSGQDFDAVVFGDVATPFATAPEGR